MITIYLKRLVIALCVFSQLGCPASPTIHSLPEKASSSPISNTATDSDPNDRSNNNTGNSTSPSETPVFRQNPIDNYGTIPDAANRIARNYEPQAQPISMPGGIFAPQPSVADDCNFEISATITPICLDHDDLYEISISATLTGSHMAYLDGWNGTLSPCGDFWMRDWPWRVVIQSSNDTSFFDIWMKKQDEFTAHFDAKSFSTLDSKFFLYEIFGISEEHLMLPISSAGEVTTPYPCRNQKCLDEMPFSGTPDSEFLILQQNQKVPKCFSPQ